MKQKELFEMGPIKQIRGRAIVRYPGTRRRAYCLILECGHVAYRKPSSCARHGNLIKRAHCLECSKYNCFKDRSMKQIDEPTVEDSRQALLEIEYHINEKDSALPNFGRRN